ncbi:uncharacterized protein LOC129305221 isoform X2 [Prosopis cineraria]|uniref:uncharacterized protein LOC129305221 isoform X2 n=1 Tax=Prosopis cineraria TaxID=364024 RepID=UPI00240F5B76|nr:uncharacterized protein LOC129305221 isoform X2 [Prosopis cineraria]
METEKRRSKGGFLSLFDWNGKSRKKLFSDNPNLRESKQGKENVESTAKSQLTRMHGDGDVAGPSYTANCDFSGAISIDSDEGCGTKAPGLVARLMGLESLPASTATELSSTALYGSDSLGSCHEHVLGLMNGYQPVDYMNMPLKPDKSSTDATELRVQKVANRPIKKFQTEMLPPKSAKPIPVTHNKLLSPIKSPGLIPPKNAAHIMEAAAKIIEASPWPYMKNNTSSAGPSSLPLRILSLKEKMETVQSASMPEKPVDSSTANPVKGKPSGRSNNSYKCAPAFKALRDSEKNSSRHLGSKGKSSSAANESKANVQKRDTLTSNGKRGCVKHKEQNEMKSNRLSRSQKPKVQQSMQPRTGTSRNSSVLGQNNQKQNGAANKGASASRIDSNNKPATQVQSSESTTRGRKTTNEGAIHVNSGPKRLSRRGTNTQKEFSQSKAKNVAQKKRYISRDVFDEARDPNKAVINYESKSIKYNITTDGSMNQDAYNMKESKDVISFTFTSPLRRNMPESQSSIPLMGTKDNTDVTSLDHFDLRYPEKLSSAPSGLHTIDGDALSVLLEKKLRELTSRIKLPQIAQATEESSSLPSSLPDEMPGVVSIISGEQESFHPDLSSDTLNGTHDFGFSSSDDLVHNKNQLFQTSEATEETCYSSNWETGNDPGCQHPRPVAIFDTPCASESYLDSEESAYGSTVYSSTQDEEMSNFSPINESAPVENGVNLYEQRSSLLAEGDVTGRQLSGMLNFSDFKVSGNTELEYVKDILSSAELMTEDFVLGQINEVIMPNLFDMLENQIDAANDYQAEDSKLERKVWFDCVSECLELRCWQAFAGSCKGWPRWMELNHRKGRLAEELYNEILGYKSMEEVMVDELVSKDMGTHYGKWLDFDMEAFEKVSEIECEISTFLIEEIISDLLLG